MCKGSALPRLRPKPRWLVAVEYRGGCRQRWTFDTEAPWQRKIIGINSGICTCFLESVPGPKERTPEGPSFAKLSHVDFAVDCDSDTERV